MDLDLDFDDDATLASDAATLGVSTTRLSLPETPVPTLAPAHKWPDMGTDEECLRMAQEVYGLCPLVRHSELFYTWIEDVLANRDVGTGRASEIHELLVRERNSYEPRVHQQRRRGNWSAVAKLQLTTHIVCCAQMAARMLMVSPLRRGQWKDRCFWRATMAARIMI